MKKKVSIRRIKAECKFSSNKLNKLVAELREFQKTMDHDDLADLEKDWQMSFEVERLDGRIDCLLAMIYNQDPYKQMEEA